MTLKHYFWIPAFAGMTDKGHGMTGKRHRMTQPVLRFPICCLGDGDGSGHVERTRAQPAVATELAELPAEVAKQLPGVGGGSLLGVAVVGLKAVGGISGIGLQSVALGAKRNQVFQVGGDGGALRVQGMSLAIENLAVGAVGHHVAQQSDGILPSGVTLIPGWILADRILHAKDTDES